MYSTIQVNTFTLWVESLVNSAGLLQLDRIVHWPSLVVGRPCKYSALF